MGQCSVSIDAHCWPPSFSNCTSATGCRTTGRPDCNSSATPWLLNVYNEVTYDQKKTTVISELRIQRDISGFDCDDCTVRRQEPNARGAGRGGGVQPNERRATCVLRLRSEPCGGRYHSVLYRACLHDCDGGANICMWLRMCHCPRVVSDLQRGCCTLRVRAVDGMVSIGIESDAVELT